MNLKKLSIWVCSGLLVSLFSGLTPLNDNLCNLNSSMVVYAEGRVFDENCINSTTYNEETKTLTIPDGFTEIGIQDLARHCPNLETVYIPDSVEIIGNSAFWGCEKLRRVYMSSDSKLRKIEGSAFSKCTSLETITLPGSIKEIGQWAFKECTSLTEINIPYNVESIGESAFWYCTSLENISLPQEIKKIEDSTFTGCHSLTSINIPAHVREIGQRAFSDCTSLREISLPSGLQLIDRGAFDGCEYLTEIWVPDKVKMVANDAFYGCSSLKKISIPNAAKIFDSFSLSFSSELRIVDDLRVSSNKKIRRYACENRDAGRTDVHIPLIANPSFSPSSQLQGIRENHETMVNTPNFIKPILRYIEVGTPAQYSQKTCQLQHLKEQLNALDDLNRKNLKLTDQLNALDDLNRKNLKLTDHLNALGAPDKENLQFHIAEQEADIPDFFRPGLQNMDVPHAPINNHQEEQLPQNGNNENNSLADDCNLWDFALSLFKRFF